MSATKVIVKLKVCISSGRVYDQNGCKAIWPEVALLVCDLRTGGCPVTGVRK